MAEHFLSNKTEEIKTCIICTYCDSPVPAVNAGLMCEASMCDHHLRIHSKSAQHVLSDPVTSQESSKCSVPKKIPEHNCPEDIACNCGTCRLDGKHSGHQDELVQEKAEKEILINVPEKLSLKRKQTEKRVQSVQEHKKGAQETTAGRNKRATVLFSDLIKHLKNKVLNGISKQEEQVSLCYPIQQLGIKKGELSRKMLYPKELTIMPGPVWNTKGGNKEATCTNLTDIVTNLEKGIYIQEASNMLLDINTAGNNVLLTSDLKSALWSVVSQSYPKTRKRFKDPQILSLSKFSTGKHYWRVETSKAGNWRVGMCYRSIARKGFGSYIGCNNKSWGLCKWNNQFSVMHNCKEIPLSQSLSCQRLGIYLDYEAGQLSFYELCDPIRHLHTFTATFTEPLHAAFRIWLDSLGAAWILLKS
ncbi:E3 ubiquitin-protein ligase TRIM58-like [Mixophyes fleayi]|uniref:E3 ubiquitin-protein ligase TRIM58-like n=1 Tax=Mixophyes fleayi TaxID=3061075 RepID=UPI003F4D9967